MSRQINLTETELMQPLGFSSGDNVVSWAMQTLKVVETQSVTIISKYTSASFMLNIPQQHK